MKMPVRIVVIGCGYWGRNLARCFQSLGVLSAVSDTLIERAAVFSREFEVPATSLDDILSSSEINAVVIATPAVTHAPIALQTLAKGKHAFIEKPLAMNVEDAEQVRESAEREDRIVLVGHLLQYHPAFLKLRELVACGELGRLQYIYSNHVNLGKIRREENVFWSFAPHDISMILSLSGDMPEEVEAVAHCYLHDKIADVTITHLKFANGINAHMFVSWLHPFKEQKFVVIGDGGMAVFDDGQPWSRKLQLYRHKVTWGNGMPETSRGDAQAVALDEAEPLKAECQHFVDCIQQGRRPRTDALEGLRVLQVLDAAQRAMTSGEAISLAGARALHYFAHETVCIDEDCSIGAGTRIWHFSHILNGTKIGRDCVIGQNVMVGPNVIVGDHCKIQNNVSIYEGVVLERGVFCGPSCVFTNINTPRAEINRKNEFLSTRVGRGATIGANATIVCGYRLGHYCFVAAGAVVTRDVPPHALVAGNPARQIGWVSHAGERLRSDLVCPRTGRTYGLTDSGQLFELANPEAA